VTCSLLAVGVSSTGYHGRLYPELSAHYLHEIFHAIYYVLKSGCPRRLGTSLPLVNARGVGSEWPSGPIEESEGSLGLSEASTLP
jgi:hypothetical protein